MPNRWTEFVRDFANRNNLTYGCAMSKPECKSQYHKKYPKPLTKKQQKEREGQETQMMSEADVNVAEPRKKKAGRKAIYATDEERRKAKREQTLASNKRRYAEKKAEKQGAGILKDIRSGIKTAGRKVSNTYDKTTKALEIGINKTTDFVKDKTEDVAEYGKAIVYGRNDYPPKVRTILKNNGAEVITSYTLKRTPVVKLLTTALSAVSLGEFGKRFRGSEFDDLFHLFLEMTTESGKKISIEKNEVINMEVNPKIRDKEQVQKITNNVPQGLTLDTIMNNAQQKMGSKFFGYSARDNNCQDFIVAVLQSNNIGDEGDIAFVKQDTKELFRDLPFLRKFSNTLTTIGARANVATTGAGVDEKELIISSKKKISPTIIKMPRKSKQEILMSGFVGPDMMGGALPMGLRPIDAAVYKKSKGMMGMGHSDMRMSCPHCETSMEGGKINIGRAFSRAFDPNKNGVANVANKAGDYITSKKGGLATDLIQYGIPAASSALLGGLATAATGGNPVAGVAASALGSKLGAMGASQLQKKTGTGMRKGRFAKGSQEAKDYMASIRKKK
jgi:hypothetical protein